MLKEDSEIVMAQSELFASIFIAENVTHPSATIFRKNVKRSQTSGRIAQWKHKSDHGGSDQCFLTRAGIDVMAATDVAKALMTFQSRG